MEITFAKAYEIARVAAIEGDPDAHIAVSGTQATNAYDGADWSRLDRVIDDFFQEDVAAVVVMRTIADAADVHPRAQADVLQRRQCLDLALVVNVLVVVCHILSHKISGERAEMPRVIPKREPEIHKNCHDGTPGTQTINK